MAHIIVLTGDSIEERLAGPGIRALEIARQLSLHHQVTLACPGHNHKLNLDPVRISTYTNEPSSGYLNGFDIIIAPGSLKLPGHITRPLVADLYDPYILSNFSRMDPGDPVMLDRLYDEAEFLLEKIRNADFFMCASEKQKDFWLGMLAAFHRLNPASFQSDPDFNQLISVVPFGIPEQAPRKPTASPFPDPDPELKWLIWGGGIWNWFDPISLLKGFAGVATRFPKLRLYFMGTRHPDPRMPEMERTRQTIRYVEEIPLLKDKVFFGDWIPYSRRGDYLTSAFAGVSSHFQHIETRFSYRTRLLDCIWARLPILCTRGDSLADLVESRGLGLTVPPSDPDRIEKAIERLLTDTGFLARCTSNLENTALEFQWNRVLQPLFQYCESAGSLPTHTQSRKTTSDPTMATGCESRKEPAGEIVRGLAVEQPFECHMKNLCRFDLMLATYARRNTGTLSVELKSRCGLVLYGFKLDMEIIRDNAWSSFTFEPIPHSSGKRYHICIRADHSTPGNAVTVWTDPEGPGHYRLGSQICKGSLTFRVFAKNETYLHPGQSIRNYLINRLTGF